MHCHLHCSSSPPTHSMIPSTPSMRCPPSRAISLSLMPSTVGYEMQAWLRLLPQAPNLLWLEKHCGPKSQRRTAELVSLLLQLIQFEQLFQRLNTQQRRLNPPAFSCGSFLRKTHTNRACSLVWATPKHGGRLELMAVLDFWYLKLSKGVSDEIADLHFWRTIN